MTSHTAILSAQSINTRILDTEVKISGTFGEFRGNHFHAGIDYKTEKKEGIPVFSADDGYVYRILVSRNGYGKALYINHKNGITTVYAHLRDFEGAIADTVWGIQKKQKNFELDYRPPPGKIKIKKGQVIGFSGNTGSSEGPHLHFETRYTDSEKPFDPSSLGFTFEDLTPPDLNTLWIYDLPSDSIVYPLPEPRGFDGITKDTIYISGRFLVGLNVHDLAGTEKNRLGIKTAKLFLDDRLKVSYAIQPFEFQQSKEIIGVIDQGLRQKGKQSFLLHASNSLSIPFFENKFSNGIIELNDNLHSIMTIELEDIMGNKSIHTFHLMSRPILSPKQSIDSSCVVIKPGSDTTFQTGIFSVEIGPKSLLGISCIQFEQSEKQEGLSPIFLVGSPAIPIISPIKLKFLLDSTAIQNWDKIVVTRLEANNTYTSLGGKLGNGFISVESGTLGKFQLQLDSEPPECKKPNYFLDEFTEKKALALELEDNLSGVGEFRCKINGKWVYSEFYPSRKTLIIYNIDKYKGQTLEVKATDKRNNTSRNRFKIEP
ncbi:MAG: M23 family metallopeptidase [Bacteroidota bacterium]